MPKASGRQMPELVVLLAVFGFFSLACPVLLQLLGGRLCIPTWSVREQSASRTDDDK